MSKKFQERMACALPASYVPAIACSCLVPWQAAGSIGARGGHAITVVGGWPLFAQEKLIPVYCTNFSVMGPIHIVLFVAFAAMIFFKLYFSKKAIIKRQLKKMPVKPISRVSEGETARITGMAVLVGTPLIAPLSRRECCHYHVRIEQKVSSGKNSHWKTIIEEEKGTDYLVEDNGSYACLDAEAPMTHLVPDRTYKSGLFNDAAKNLTAYLQLHGITSEDWLGFNKTMRYYEGIIEPGEAVTALGKGEWKTAATIGFPEHYGTILNLCADDKKKYLFISDDEMVVGVK